MRGRGLGLHVFCIDDGPIVRHEGCREVDQGIFHPKTLLAGGTKNKKHSLVGRHIGTKHQPRCLLLWGRRHLDLNLMNADSQGCSWQVHLGRWLRQNQKKWSKKAQKQGQANRAHGRIVDESRPPALRNVVPAAPFPQARL